MPEASDTGRRFDARPTRPRRRRWLAAKAVILLSTVVVGLVACGGGGGSKSAKAKHATAPTTTSLPAGYSLAAQAKVPQIGIYDNPAAATPTKMLPNPWLLNNEADKAIPQVFLVEEERPDWVKVLLADRPNGSSGWVRASDVQLTPNPYRLQVRLGDHKIRVFQGANSIYEGQVAIGASATPTPPGKYYTRVLIQAPDPNTVYGPFAYGLSAHSEVLNEYNGGDAEVGVHGNNDASVLGKSVTHGCIRMDNDEITKLSKVLPLGTPVEIVS